MTEPRAVTGIATTSTVPANGGLVSQELGLLVAADPAAFYEGFCPNCRVPLGGDTGSWCPQCRAAWRVIP